jgi:hypothetical protein
MNAHIQRQTTQTGATLGLATRVQHLQSLTTHTLTTDATSPPLALLPQLLTAANLTFANISAALASPPPPSELTEKLAIVVADLVNPEFALLA